MIKKGLYLKKRVLLGSIGRSWETERLTIKVIGEVTLKDTMASILGQNLRVVSFMRNNREEKEKKYGRYAKRREERNLKTQALSRYVFGISKDENFKPRTSMLIVFIDKYLEEIDLPHADPLMIKLRIGNAIVSWVLVDGGSSSDIIFWNALWRMGKNEG